ncbi:MAG: DUF1080 domain-containing protein [Tepidisphaeraceae bacterium]
MHNRLRLGALALFVLIVANASRAQDGWTKLFNGKDLTGWETYLSKPQGQAEPIGVNKDPSKVYTVTDDGQLRISGETFGVISTTQDYENYHLRLEFKWGEKRWPPRHDKKRDSGICYHAFGEYGTHGNHWTRSHECQIQEGDCGDYWSLQANGSFTLAPTWATFDPKGALGEPGGTRVVRSADHEKPHGEWNTIEVICRGDTATHLVNGQIVNHLTNSRKREGDGSAPLTKGRIQLQSEGAEIFYRNIELRNLTAGDAQLAATSQPALLPTAPPELSGMKKLIGKDLADWDGDKRLWRVEEGSIIGQTTPQATSKTNTFLIYRGGNAGGEVKDFELRLSYRITGGNSGVQYRSAIMENPTDPANTWRVSGYQAEIADLAGKDAFLYHEQGEKTRGYPEKSRYLCYVGDKVTIDENGKSTSVGKLADNAALAATYRKGDWNDYVIIARGNTIKHFLNGYQTVEATDNDPKNSSKSGLLALQLHQGPPMKVEFRDIRLKQFDAPR